jgi:hypothetical protein
MNGLSAVTTLALTLTGTAFAVITLALTGTTVVVAPVLARILVAIAALGFQGVIIPILVLVAALILTLAGAVSAVAVLARTLTVALALALRIPIVLTLTLVLRILIVFHVCVPLHEMFDVMMWPTKMKACVSGPLMQFHRRALQDPGQQSIVDIVVTKRGVIEAGRA